MGRASDRSSITEVIRDYRRDQVIEAARRLFGERGSLDVSMSEIARAAGVSRSTVYNHFTTREDVLVACLHVGQAQLVEAVAAAVDAADGPVAQLTALVETCIARVDASPGFFRMMTAMTSANPVGVEAASMELSLTGVQVGETLRAVLAAGVEAGVFAVDVETAARLVGYVLVGLLDARVGDDVPTAAETASQTVELLVAGFAGGAR